MQQTTDETRAHIPKWMTLQEAAAVLALPLENLSRSLAHHARVISDHVIAAEFDGITARRFGRLWRVRRPDAATDAYPSWQSAEQAAACLDLSIITLRRALERNAHPEPDCGTVAHVSGIIGRKLGRLWRVHLSTVWH